MLVPESHSEIRVTGRFGPALGRQVTLAGRASSERRRPTVDRSHRGVVLESHSTSAGLACRPSRGPLDNGGHATWRARSTQQWSRRRKYLPLRAPPGARSARRSVVQTAWTVGTRPRRPAVQFTTRTAMWAVHIRRKKYCPVPPAPLTGGAYRPTLRARYSGHTRQHLRYRRSHRQSLARPSRVARSCHEGYPACN